jgi:hypothetical protein
LKVFISWSGEPSRTIACELVSWLCRIVQAVEPWMSDEAIGSGKRWRVAIGDALNDTDFGIVCVTRINQHAPWLMFEAGALAKHLAFARVVPLCIDMETTDLSGPLSDWQARKLDRDGMKRVVSDINAATPKPLPRDALTNLFDLLWPEFEDVVTRAREAGLCPEHVPRSEREMLEELLERVRRVERNQPAAPSHLAPGDAVTVNGQTVIVGSHEQARRIEGLVASGRLTEGSVRLAVDDHGVLRPEAAALPADAAKT